MLRFTNRKVRWKIILTSLEVILKGLAPMSDTFRSLHSYTAFLSVYPVFSVGMIEEPRHSLPDTKARRRRQFHPSDETQLGVPRLSS